MKEIATILLILICYHTSCGQSSSGNEDSCDTFLYLMKPREDLLRYIDNPCPNDSTCKEGILRAEAQVIRGQIKFLMPMHLATVEARQVQQLRALCNASGLIFDYEGFSCLVNSGQTDGCYGLYMDKIIAQKFGIDFKERLLKKADSMYVASSPTVHYTKCDTLPRLYDKDIHESLQMDLAIKEELFNKLKVSKYGYYPQVDIGFNIDTTGIPSNYFLNQFIVYDDISENTQYKSALIQLAFDYVKRFRLWKPGVVLNEKVKTEYNVRISFLKGDK